jgi:hypothetical protein
MADHSIAGNWRGHYAYHNVPDQGSGFGAKFIDENGVLTGEISDDFWPGEATLTGSFSFPSLTFTKVYLFGSLAQINYVGTMTEDGNTINGTWSIVEARLSYRGSWTAYRIDDEEKKAEKKKQIKIKTPKEEEVI